MTDQDTSTSREDDNADEPEESPVPDPEGGGDAEDVPEAD
jgi:hypothetical protein